MSDSLPSLAALRHLVAAHEATRAENLVDGAAVGSGWPGGGLAGGRLHDVYAGEAEDGATAIGFAVALALAAGALPILWIRTERDEGRAGRLHAGGLLELGLPPEALVLVVTRDETARLRVAADAARCPGLGMLLVESRGPAPELDLTATRRLMLAAEGSGVTVLSVRIGAAVTPSAAATRWRVAAAPSRRLAAGAPGPPAFDVERLRQRGGPAGARACVEWNRETRTFVQTSLAGAGVPVAAGGATARHPPSSVRRAG